MKSLLDPSFRYTPSIRTDIKKTFARIRREAQLRQDSARQPRDEAARKVAVLFPEHKAASR